MSLVAVDGDAGFARLVKARRLAVVGPARTLQGKRQGPLIDSFDLIARFNETFAVIGPGSEWATDYGTRTDIVYANQVILRTLLTGRAARQRLADRCRALDVKYLVCTNNSGSYTAAGDPSPSCPAADAHVCRDLSALLGDHGLSTRCRVVTVVPQLLRTWMGGQVARSGFIGIADLMLLDAARVYVTGATFYHEGGHILADAAAVMHPLRNRDGSPARDAGGIGHDSYAECEIMRMLARAFHARVGVDEDLLKILGYTNAPELWPAESHTSSASSTAAQS
jgi:hypothetical protein